MAQVDPRDMLNNFCFHVYAKISTDYWVYWLPQEKFFDQGLASLKGDLDVSW